MDDLRFFFEYTKGLVLARNKFLYASADPFGETVLAKYDDSSKGLCGPLVSRLTLRRGVSTGRVPGDGGLLLRLESERLLSALVLGELWSGRGSLGELA